MAFKLTKRIDDTLVKSSVIANSVTVGVGDAIIGGATGHATVITGAANTSGVIIGVIIGITGLNGKVYEVDRVTTASDNETTKKYYATWIPAYEDNEFTVNLTAAAGTTTDSAGFGFFNMDSSAGSHGKLLESSFALWSGTAGQFSSYGTDPNDPTNLTVIGHFNKKL